MGHGTVKLQKPDNGNCLPKGPWGIILKVFVFSAKGVPEKFHLNEFHGFNRDLLEQLSKKFPVLMKSEALLPRSEEHSNGELSCVIQCSLHPHILHN
jgi:hypothetical protein